MQLHSLIEPITGFESDTPKEKIKVLAWWLHTHGGKELFAAPEIRACFHRLDIDEPPAAVRYRFGACDAGGTAGSKFRASATASAGPGFRTEASPGGRNGMGAKTQSGWTGFDPLQTFNFSLRTSAKRRKAVIGYIRKLKLRKARTSGATSWRWREGHGTLSNNQS
jgi:hypothetical protein